MFYYVYIVECKDTTLYTGFTTNLERRVSDHNTSKRGARYTKTRRPVKLVYFEKYATESEAKKREYQLKKLRREEKLRLIKNSDTLEDGITR